MNINIDDIKVPDRIRIENGNVSELAKSIMDHGLINPITVMESPDGYLLIAGYRRLHAVEMLGMTEIEASVLPPCDAEEQLRIEIEENEVRKDFTIGERVRYAIMLNEVEKAKARLRMGGHVSRDSGKDFGPAREIVAKKVGFSNGRQLDRVLYVNRIRPDLMELIDHGVMSIGAAYECARGATRRKNDVPEKVNMTSYEDILNFVEEACAHLIETVEQAAVEYTHVKRTEARSEAIFATIKETCDRAMDIFGEGTASLE